MATKDPVRLRQRITSTGLKSLYLDIYVDGKRKNEYLKLYLVKE
ncbi:MAG: site-specific integrase, partial [Salinivirgaceae bacterium]|nr:site-specific integrase [Salinivirgaceae bacterium]